MAHRATAILTRMRGWVQQETLLARKQKRPAAIRCQPHSNFTLLTVHRLSASTTPVETSSMETTSAVESVVGMELAAVKSFSTMEAAVVTMDIPSATPTLTPTPTAIVIPTMAPVSAAIVAAIPKPRRMAPVIPGSHANKHAVYEVVWPVIAIGRAGIRIIVVVAVFANRRSGHVARSHSHANSTKADSYSHLRLRVRQRNH